MRRRITQPILSSIAQYSCFFMVLGMNHTGYQLRSIILQFHRQKKKGPPLSMATPSFCILADQLPAIALSTASAPTATTAESTTPSAACTRFLRTRFVDC